MAVEPSGAADAGPANSHSLHTQHRRRLSTVPRWLSPAVRGPPSWLLTRRYAILAVATTICLLLASAYSHAPKFAAQLLPKQKECPVILPKSDPLDPRWKFNAKRDGHNYAMSLETCEQAFPGLFDEIDDRVKRRKHDKITKEELPEDRDWPRGTIRAMLYEGKLYVISASGLHIRRSRPFITLSTLNRALIPFLHDPTLPNIEFIFSIEDFSVDENLPIWSYDRKVDDNNTWLMPDYGFYAWPEPGLGTYDEVRKRMEDVEKDVGSFEDKIPKLLWRGALTASLDHGVRTALVKNSEGMDWADVKVLNWSAPDSEDHRMPIEDHCKYQYVAHTEGVTWSGRLKYIQNCNSVMVVHPLQYLTPQYAMMVPSGPKQNFIPVKRDFSDLDEKMKYYLDHPKKARRIARNSVKTFRDRYLTPAAEACYWRKMVYAWAQVSWRPDFYNKDGSWRGVPFESFALMRELSWEPA
ncbi:MAG: hypothetical protein M1831_001563 [Alyxoria varia]|nr:MAG: hypothetical protein M1831_001563 [Alyxoria varia]